MAREYFCAYHSLLESLTPFGDAECGRLFRSCLKYSMTGEEPELSGNERFIWPTLKGMIDRDKQAYSATCEAAKTNGSKGGRPKKEKTGGFSENRGVFSETQKSQEEEKEEEKEKDEDEEEKSISAAAPLAPPGKAKKEPMHKHGEFGWVLLTDAQYNALLEKLGAEELGRCIAYIDQAAQSTGNKNRWKDWNLVIQRCAREGWGKRQNGGSGQKRTFADVYRDRMERGRQG